MKTADLRHGKRTFISQLYQYKDKEAALLHTLKNTKEIIDIFHSRGLADELQMSDVSTAIRNKYTFLIGAFLRSDMDLVFFADEGELYPANFFAGRILKHFVLRMSDILSALDFFLEEAEKFDNRTRELRKKKLFKMLANSLLKGNSYDFDDVARTAMDEMSVKFDLVKSLFDEFYKEDPFHNYPSMIEYYLKNMVDNIATYDKEKLTSNLVSFYEIDVDFLGTIKQEKQIILIRKLYLKYMSEAGLDTSGIVEEPKIKYFTSKHPEVFDPTEYLHMSVNELATKTFMDEIDAAGDIFEDRKAFEALKNILGDVGIVMLDPITIDIGEEEPSEQQKSKEIKRK